MSQNYNITNCYLAEFTIWYTSSNNQTLQEDSLQKSNYYCKITFSP